MVFFIKYEYWLNYLNELNKSTPTYLISEYLENKCSLDGTAVLQKSIRYFYLLFCAGDPKVVTATRKTNVVVSGDTRFDRVAAILDKDSTLDYISQFKMIL
jgi:3-deoxy-D-manno-octulosonic-acid transferase